MPAANRYTTTEFIAKVRRKGHIPVAQTPFADADILDIADDELSTSILDQLLTIRENYYLAPYDYPVAIGSNISNFDIPTRAVGGGLADIHYVIGTTIYQTTRTELGQQFSTNAAPQGIGSFYLQANQIVCVPPPSGGIMRLWMYMRPNKLVPVASAAQITAIDFVGNVLTFGTIPATFTTSTPMDFIKDQPHFDWRAIDQTPTNVTTTTMTFSTLPSTLVVGDWVALAGQTPIPQIPVEFTPLLVQRVIVKYYEIQGYLEKMSAAEKKLEQMEKAVFAAVNPRVREEPKRIVSSSDLVGGSLRWRAWRAT